MDLPTKYEATTIGVASNKYITGQDIPERILVRPKFNKTPCCRTTGIWRITNLLFGSVINKDHIEKAAHKSIYNPENIIPDLFNALNSTRLLTPS